MIRVYTSATKSYVPKARVLAASVKELHPDYWFCLVLSDSLPSNFNIDEEPFDEVMTIQDLGIDNLKQWTFYHSVVELCTAVKGTALVNLLQRPETDAVFYLDPDIWVMSELTPLVHLFEEHDVLLTPHLLHPEDDKWLIHGNEIVTTLAHGIYNLGFIGVRASEEGLRFAKWWEKRLLYFCYDDVPQGLFTDQRWCDFVPVFFPTSHIVRDIGCNVATWNISYRPITKNGGKYLAGGEPLRFYHFTGFDSGNNFNELLTRFAKGYPAAFELWEDYGRMLAKHGHDDSSLHHWAFAAFDNGHVISKHARQAYRNNYDLQQQFSDPFASDNTESYFHWCQEHGMLDEHAEEPAQELRRLRQELESVYASRSWRVTWPIRWAKAALSRKRPANPTC